MEQFTNWLQSMNIYVQPQYILTVGGIFLLMIIMTVVNMNSNNRRVKKWLDQNPTASKIYIQNKSNLMVSKSLTILSVDGEVPVAFNEGFGMGIYVTPGSHVIESTFSKSRPGVMYKTVSTTYDASKQEVTAEANKSYNYYFDTKKEAYVFEETK